MAIIDQHKTYRPIEDRIARTTNPRHRLMLQRLLQHSRGEVEADLEAVMGSLAPHPIYRSWQGGPEMNPEGTDNVRKFYIEEIFGKGRHVLESGKDRIIVDDDSIVTEGTLRMVLWGRDARESRMPVDDDDACYLLTVRMLIVWPFDENAYIIGEESWSVADPTNFLRKIEDTQVPDTMRAYIARRLQTLARVTP